MKNWCEIKNKNSSGNILLQTLFSCLATLGLVSAGLSVSYYYGSNQVNKVENNQGLLNHLKTSLTPENSQKNEKNLENQNFIILGEENILPTTEGSVLSISSTPTIQAIEQQGIYQLSVKRYSINSQELARRAVRHYHLKTNSVNSRTIENRSIESKDISSRLTIHTLRIGNSSDRPSHFNLKRGDLYIKSNLEVDGAAYFDSTIYVRDNASLSTLSSNTLATETANVSNLLSNSNLTIKGRLPNIDTITIDDFTHLYIKPTTIIGRTTTPNYSHIDGTQDLYIEDDLEVRGIIYGTISGAYSPSGDLDMDTNIITNIGNNNTNFTTAGGLNLAGNLNVNNQFFVDTATGNVGIGEVSPGARLDVEGADSLNTTLAGHIRGATGTGLVITNSGNVGIGITNPTQKLHVAGNAYIEGTFGNVFTTGNEPYFYNDTNSGSSNLKLVSHNSSITADEEIGNLTFSISTNGSDEYPFSSIRSFVDGAVGSTSDLPSRLSFFTIPDGSGTQQERMTIKNDGNVGINDTTPTYKLDVNGTGRFTGTVAASNLSGTNTGDQTITLTGDVTGSGTGSFATTIAANVVGANELNVTGNGTTAQYLKSDADGSFTWATPTDNNTVYTAGNDLDLSGTTFNIESQLDYVSTISRASSNLTLQTTTSGHIILSPAGNVGIGTTGPETKLDIGSDQVGATSVIRLTTNNNRGGGYLGGAGYANAHFAVGVKRTNNTWTAQDIYASVLNQDEGNIKFYTDTGLTIYGDYTPTERMRIDTNGNVGIGTTGPEDTLTLDGTAPVLTVRSGGYLKIRPTANDWDMRIGSGGLASSMYMGIFSGGDLVNPRMVVKASGNVGIGTTEPGAKLVVDGAIGLASNLMFEDSGGTLRSTLFLNSDNVIYKANNTSDHIFQDSAGNELMRITDEGTTGNVGIGKRGRGLR